MSLSFKQIEIFYAVVVSGSISNAMGLTGLAQPTISQQVARMEKLLGQQLFHRNRTGTIELTPAGEYWYRAATELLSKRDSLLAYHNAHFSNDQLVLRFGTTPSLRGRFLKEVGRLAVIDNRFSRCEFFWALTSHEVVEMLETHRLNCAIVTAPTVVHHQSTLAVDPLFRDRIVWTVPRDVPDEMVAEALNTRNALHPALARYVNVTALVPWHDQTQDWYHSYLPRAAPFFSCQTHEAAAGFVAAGLATTHSPLSLIPSLSESVLSKVKFYELGRFGRDVVFVMPRHLQSLNAFAEFRAELTSFVKERYGDGAVDVELLPLPGQAPVI